MTFLGRGMGMNITAQLGYYAGYAGVCKVDDEFAKTVPRLFYQNDCVLNCMISMCVDVAKAVH